MMIKLVLASLFVFTGVHFAQAKPSKTKNAQKRSKKSNAVEFEDLLVQGKYHFSDEAVVTVEKDKVLDGLLSVRKDFKDRIRKSASLYK